MTTVVLNEHEFLRISGPDARQFLQGQVSCNVDLLSPERSLSGALCNLKGRVIADFRLLQQGDDYLLQTMAGMADQVLTTLSKYAVFSKVELQRFQPPSAPLGLIAEHCSELSVLADSTPEEFNGVVQSEELALIRIPGCSLRFEAWCFNAAGEAKLEQVFSEDVPLSLPAWQREDLRAGIIHVDPGMSEQYTPQLLNYDISGVIDFNKGCYTGQEVVARMYYRGKPKQRMYLLHATAPVSDASEVSQRLGEESRNGEILVYSNGEGEPNFLLAVLDTAMVTGEAEFGLSDQEQARLTLVSLPYFEDE